MKSPKITPITGRVTTTRLAKIVAADLAAAGVEFTPDDVPVLLRVVFDAIGRATASGHDVAITNFGTWFSTRTRRVMRRNPQNGEPIPSPAHQRVRFRPSPTLVAGVRAKNRKFTIRKSPRTGQ
ncbi:HU family DNA-binding protein [Streptomyces sp. NPDC007903]|uniref:HU family DNA-binding protein n=1 Tax=Streptomyces sp. NPDC007903 TaxID=3364786 RepID=UPI0036E0D95D